MLKLELKAFLIFVLLSFSRCQDSALPEEEQDICIGRSYDIECKPTQNTDFTVVITEAVYGTHKVPSSVCLFNNTDCFEPSEDEYCYFPDETCTVYAYDTKLENCENKLADYLHVRHRCIPETSKVINNYNVCDKTVTQITDSKGFISSPNYPRYEIVENECVQKIVAPSNKVINIWFASVDIESEDEYDECDENYITITDTTGTYTVCGYRKYSLQNRLCSSVIYVSYRAIEELNPEYYRGFRIYYEFVDRTTQPSCSTNTPGIPTTPIKTTRPIQVTDLQASSIQRLNVCKNEAKTIRVPNGYTLHIINSYYGVTNDQTCETINPDNCKSVYTLLCASQASCTVSLLSNIPLLDCGNRPANYIQLQYRYLPVISSQNNSICDSGDIILKNSSYGIITNPNYPQWNPNLNCKRKLIAPAGHVIRTYLTDINIEAPDEQDGQCKQGYLQFESECDSKKYCGRKTSNGLYELISCSNYLVVSYVSSTSPYDLRGFNMYIEVIKDVLDAPSAEYRQDVCSDEKGYMECKPTASSNYTVVVSEAFYGISATNKSSCEYKEGDCVDAATDDFCYYADDTCEPNAYKYETLPSCGNQYAGYLHLRYKCVPLESAVIPEYNICDKTIKEITQSKGFISSPMYPEYAMVPDVCIQKIVAPSSKSINIWIVNMDTYEDYFDECEEDFISITDITGTYTYCGWRKVSLENKLCSSVVYVSYLAKEDLPEYLYTGFRIYYEFVDRKPELNCPTGTPGTPTPPVYTTTTRPLIDDLYASHIETLFICISEEKKIEIPSGYVLFPIGMYYGVTENGSCSNISPQDCKTPTVLNCPLEGTCSINFNVNHLMPSCGNKYATYIEFKYRFMPLTSSKNRTICYDTTVDGSIYPYGIITNPNYPQWEPNKDCSIEINAPVGKVIRVSVTDLSIEPPDNSGRCQTGYLEIKSDCEDVLYCGNRGSNSHVVTSCSNKLTIRYKSTTSSLLLRGFNAFFEIINQDIAGNENRTDLCVTQHSAELECPTSYTTNFTNVVTTAFYGAPRNSGSTCQYSEGDCYVESTDEYCWSPYETCYIYVDDDIEIPSCGNKIAEYLHLRHRCIPVESITIPDHNVCDNKLQQITVDKAFISSPNYPVYTMVHTECMKKIVAPANKVINMWVIMDMKGTDSSDTCVNDYVRITDNTGTYTTCGFGKYSLEKKLCSSVVYVTYKAPADLYVSAFRGARIYYEFVDRSTLPGCATNTPAPPTQPPVVPMTLGPPIFPSLTASAIYKEYICRGSETTIQVPNRFQLFPIHVYYGVTPDQNCKSINPQNCKTPTTIECKLDENCKISFPISVPIADCGGRLADYIGIEYRFVPLYTSENYTVCNNADIDGTKVKRGVITQPNYPNWEPSKNCIRRIVAPSNTYIRVYISDINIELPQESSQQCQRGYLGLDSGCQNVKYCGQKSKTGNYVFTTCSNILTISYVSSGTQNLGYRGFNLYFEIVQPEIASIQYTKDLCPGDSVDITADSNISTNFTVIITDAIFGIKKKDTTVTTAPTCKYEPGDCTRLGTSSYCKSPSQTCNIYNYYFEYITNCNDQLADYLHLRYKYIPVASGTINSYNICDRNLKDITETSAFLDSPNYPTYSQVMDECTQKIVAPNNKVIKIWFPHIHIKESEPNNDCKNDYIRIVDSVSTYKICGERKYSFENNLCASQIFITYKAASVSSSYRGFRMYYEFADRSTQPNCPTIIPTLPTLPGVITPPTQVTEILASPFYQEYVCKGKEKVIDVPATSFFFKIKAYYGYTTDPNCQNFKPSDCNSPAPLTCVSGQKCTISLYNEIEIDGCNGQKANYIGLEYRFIPLYSSKNYSICDSKPIDGAMTKAGVITNPNYPNNQFSNVYCARNISVPAGYVFRAYITDVNMEPKQGFECFSNYLALDSDTVNSKYCGEVSGSERETYVSCSGIVTVSYKSTTSNRLRGFDMYFEIIQKDSVICPTKPVPTKPTIGYVTNVIDENKSKGSKDLIGWSLGIGIPLVIIIIIGVWWFFKKSKTQKDISHKTEENFAFSKLSADA